MSDDLRQRIAEVLWNPSIDHEAYGGEKERYQQAVLEQYKLYVEIATVKGHVSRLLGVYREFVRKTGIGSPRRRRSAISDCEEAVG